MDVCILDPRAHRVESVRSGTYTCSTAMSSKVLLSRLHSRLPTRPRSAFLQGQSCFTGRAAVTDELPCAICRKDDLKLDAGRFDFQKPKQQIEYLSELGTEDVAAIASFELSPGVQPLFEALPDETADIWHASDTLTNQLFQSPWFTNNTSIHLRQTNLPLLRL